MASIPRMRCALSDSSNAWSGRRKRRTVSMISLISKHAHAEAARDPPRPDVIAWGGGRPGPVKHRCKRFNGARGAGSAQRFAT